jgi:hypothetical protein
VFEVVEVEAESGEARGRFAAVTLDDVPRLLAVIHGDHATSVRVAAIDALGKLGDRATLDALDALEIDDTRGVRVAAARAARAIRIGRSRETYDPLARLAECLDRLAIVIAPFGIHERATTDNDLKANAVGGRIPDDLALWSDWAAKVSKVTLPTIARGWKILSPRDALARRRWLLDTRNAPRGPWLPIMVSDPGDYQVYFPRSPRHGAVSCWYHDEPQLTSDLDAKPLVDHAQALLDAWTILTG